MYMLNTKELPEHHSSVSFFFKSEDLCKFGYDANRKQLLTKVRSFIVTVLRRRLNIRPVLLQPLRHQLISQTEQIPTCI